MTGDARVTAWMAAWNRIEGATKLRMEFRSIKEIDYEAPLPPDYHALMAEAAVFATLARATLEVGIDAQVWLEELERRRREDKEMMKSAVEEFLESKERRE